MSSQVYIADYGVREKKQLVRERRFSVLRYSVDEVFAILKDERFTGRVVVDMNQGGIGSQVAEDRSQFSHLTGRNSSA